MSNFFHMLFEVPIIIAAMFGCIATRVIVGQSDKLSRWVVRVPVDMLSGGAALFLVISTHPSLLTMLVLDITVATLAATIIKMAEVRGRKLLNALLPGGGDDNAATVTLTDKLNRIPSPTQPKD